MFDAEELKEICLTREEKFSGRIMTVHVDKVRLPNGKTSTREVIDHVDGVAVLALDASGHALVVTQYRYVFQKNLAELPAGKLDPGEDPAAGALRELKEETGAVPGSLESLGTILPSPGCYSERVHLFLARDLRMEEQALDPGEFLNVSRIPFDKLVRLCVMGELEDAKTVAAVLRARLLLSE